MHTGLAGRGRNFGVASSKPHALAPVQPPGLIMNFPLFRCLLVVCSITVLTSIARAQLVLNIDTEAEEFYFSGEATGTPYNGGFEGPQIFWRVGDPVSPAEIITIGNGISEGTFGNFYFYPESETFPTFGFFWGLGSASEQTVHGSSIAFSYADKSDLFKSGMAALDGATFGLIRGTGFGTVTASVSAVPEPSTYAAIFGGLVLVGTYARRRRHSPVSDGCDN